MNFKSQYLYKSHLLLILLLFAISGQTIAQDKSSENLVILYTNDTHSRLEPMPANDSRNANKGGMIRQNTYVEKARAENQNVLLFHCGDFVQGTPYYNLFKGEAEISLMNFMRFDAVCIGNHEFDYGLDVLAGMIRKADFPFLATNLDFTGTPVEGLTKPFVIIYKGDVKIGVFGLTIDPNGLVAKQNYKGMKWLDPIESANQMADYLRNEEKCDLVICLSHLGLYFQEDEVGDLTLAQQSRNIDIILGGHTHTFLRFPERRKNLDGEEVLISQMGANAIYIGRLDVTMEEVEN